MCDHTNEPGGREAAMTVIERDQAGTPRVWCDPCLAPLVTALNTAGLRTIASCCGHGRNDPSVALADGRWVSITSEPPVAYEHRSEPQGEPSDTQVDAAARALNPEAWKAYDTPFVENPALLVAHSRAQARAALRAAGGVR